MDQIPVFVSLLVNAGLRLWPLVVGGAALLAFAGGGLRGQFVGEAAQRIGNRGSPLRHRAQRSRLFAKKCYLVGHNTCQRYLSAVGSVASR